MPVESARQGKFERDIQRNLELNLALLEERIHSHTSPREIPPQTIYDYCQQRIKVRDHAVLLSPRQMLEVVATYKQWFTDHSLPIPEPEWIDHIEQFWSKQTKPRRPRS